MLTQTVIVRSQFGSVEKRQPLTGPRYPKRKTMHPTLQLAIQALRDKWEREMGRPANCSQVLPF